MDKLRNVTAKQRYTMLETERQPFLDRARDAAKMTIPTLMPPAGHSAAQRLPTPHQSLGARGVNNLSSKLLLALFPPNTPFFKAQLPDKQVDEIRQEMERAAEEGNEQLLSQAKQLETKINLALSNIEQQVQSKIESMAARVYMFQALKQLVNSGNALVHFTEDDNIRVYTLERYVVVRDPSGNPVEIVTKDIVHPWTLPEDLQELLKEQDESFDPDKVDPQTTAELYTHIYKESDQWVAVQSINNIHLEDTKTTYPIDRAIPWLPLRMMAVDGESYGRSYVEEVLGDLREYDKLAESLGDGAAIASKILFLVDPSGVTRAKDLANAENGQFVTGRREEVDTLGVEKMQEFQFVSGQMQTLETRLSYGFLLNTAIQRDAERVTAEEIRYMAGELEDALGGIYSVLSQDMQKPFVDVLMNRMEQDGELPELPDGIKTVITTGLEALGRGHDLNKLNQLMAVLAQGGEGMLARVNPANFIDRAATALGIDPEGLIKSQADIEREQQQQQMQALMEKLGPNAINQLGETTRQQQEGQAQAAQPITQQNSQSQNPQRNS